MEAMGRSKVKTKSIEREEEPPAAARGQGWPMAILTDGTVCLGTPSEGSLKCHCQGHACVWVEAVASQGRADMV